MAPSHQPVEMQPLGESSSHRSASSPPPPYPEPAPGSLGSGYRAAEDMARAKTRPQEGALDGSSMFGLGAAGWFTLLALSALLCPRLILFLAQGSEAGSPSHALQSGPLGSNVLSNGPIPSYDRGHYDSLTALESYLLRSLGMGLLALAALCVFVVVPTYKPFSPGRVPAIGVVTTLACVSAVVGWNAPLGALAVILGLGNGVVGAWGCFNLFFGGEQDRSGKKILKPTSRMRRL